MDGDGDLARLLGSRTLPGGGDVEVEEKAGGGKLSESRST